MPNYSAMLTEDPAPQLVPNTRFISDSLDAGVSPVPFLCPVAPRCCSMLYRDRMLLLLVCVDSSSTYYEDKKLFLNVLIFFFSPSFCSGLGRDKFS